MELTLLLPLLALLQSLPRPVSPTGPPAVPTLSLSPQDQLYLSGESVQLTCSPPRDAKAATIFQFYKDGGGIFPPAVPPGSSDTNVRNLELGLGHSGSYTCRYWTDPDGQEFQSAESPPVRITVRDPLLAPSLSLEPRYQVYFPREQVTLTCAALRNESVSGYRFYFQHEEQEPSTVLSSNVRARLEVTAEKRSAGTYTCAYWRQGSNGSVSENSSSISITVTARPPRPSLSLDPPHPIYIRGEQVTLRCSGQLNETAAGYRFFNQRGEQISSWVSSHGTWQISTRDAAASQAYTCLYWRVEHGREIPSEKSPPVLVSVTALQRVHYILLGTGGILLLIAALTALLCYCRRKKRGYVPTSAPFFHGSALVPKTPKRTGGVELGECARNLDPGHDSKGSKATGAGADHTEQDSEVTYALLDIQALETHSIRSKNKAKPAEDEQVLYSNVVTTFPQKAAK